MYKKKRSDTFFIPPPFIFILFFLLAMLMQSVLPVNKNWMKFRVMTYFGSLLIVINFILGLSAISKFVNKTALIPLKPAEKLEISGVYAFSRNPMYLGFLFLYAGLACFVGNSWNFMLLPFLVWTIQSYIIDKEEKYLSKKFGNQYDLYIKKVRRWL